MDNDRKVVEEGIVRRYLNSHYDRSTLLNLHMREIASDDSPAARSIDGLLEGLATNSLDDLVCWFEALVPTPQGTSGTRNPDAVFTPGWVAEMMATEAITAGRRTATVVDPSCGCGALLVAAFRRIWELHGQQHSPELARNIIDSQLHGVDLNESSVRLAKILLTLAAIEVGADNRSYRFTHLEARNSLDVDLWGDQQFEVVLGNPPYIRYHQLSESERRDYRARFRVLSEGNFNLYFAFFELAGRLCSDDGVVAYITPNAFFHAASARALRSWMVAELFPTRIVDFGCSRVFDVASTYTALTFADRRVSKKVLRYAEGFDGNHEPVVMMPPTSRFSTFTAEELGAAGRAWKLAGRETIQFLRSVQSRGLPLLEVANVHYGAATLRDGLYLLDGATDTDGFFTTSYNGEIFRIEPGATAPAVKVPDVASTSELRRHPARIIFPYTYGVGGRAVVWSRDELSQFPQARRYLEAVRTELARRDNGNKVYADWFAYGRTQSLTAWSGDRLLTPLYASSPRFLRDSSSGCNRNRIFLNGCAVTPREGAGVGIDLLDALLNSSTLWCFVEQTSAALTGGFYSYQKGTLSGFYVHDAVVARADEVLAVTGAEREAIIADAYGVRLPDRYRAVAGHV